MSTSKDQQNFHKAVQFYINKYQMNIYSLTKFIENKIKASTDIKNMIIEEILASKSQQAPINKDQLKIYMHLISAALNKVNIRGKKIQSFGQFYRLSFISSKDQKSKTNNQNQKNQQVKIQSKNAIVKNKVQQKQQPVVITKQKKSEAPRIKQQQPPKVSYQQPNITIPNKQQRKSRQEATKSPLKKLQIIQQDVVDENRISDANFKTSNTQELLLKIPQAQMMSLNSKKSVQITGYDKFGQNYLNPIIKFHIVFEVHSVYRRYSQFQKLMNDLNRRYEGFILPELPPKQGIKSNLSYFWGVDEAFLNERQLKLEQMLNYLINYKFVNRDQILQKFLTDQDFEIESNNEGGVMTCLRQFSAIAFNTKMLKIYGMAYYNYLKQFNKSQINTMVLARYKEVESLLNLCLTIDNYRNSINANFQHRRDIFKELKMDNNDRNLTITKFDKISSSSASQIKNLSKEVGKYLQLKSQQSWLNYIIRQKEALVQSDFQQLKKEKDEIVNRINIMENNLISSIQELKNEKTQYLNQVGERMIQWRKSIHP